MVQLNVKTTGGRVVSIDVELYQSILDCKQSLSAILDVPIEQQRLIFRGKVLNDTANLSSYGKCMHIASLAAFLVQLTIIH